MKLKKINRLVLEPVLAPLLADRRLCGFVFVFGAAQALLVWAGWWGWSCPFQALFGIPCPGCGLSRGLASLMSGNWQQAVHHHLYAPVTLFALTLMGLNIVMPEWAHNRLVLFFETIEKQTGVSFWMMTGLFAIWVIRIVAGFSSRMDFQLLTMNIIGR